MKKKTINAVLCKKFDEFLSSIKDESVRKLVESNSIITGGAIASMLLREKVNDYDIYFTNKETAKSVAEYYVTLFNTSNNTNGYVLDGSDCADHSDNHAGGVGLNMTAERIKIIFKSNGVATEKGVNPMEEEASVEFVSNIFEEELKIDTKDNYRPIFMSCNAITLSNKVQLIIRFHGEAKEIHENYDYIHCTNYWTSKDRVLTLKQPALESLLSKELIYVGSKYPVASIVRSRKFITRGWTINAGQYLKMCFQISQLDLTNIGVLEDQLTGVDLAYFGMLIDNLRGHIDKCKEDKKDFKLDYGYIATIIDKIF